MNLQQPEGSNAMGEANFRRHDGEAMQQGVVVELDKQLKSLFPRNQDGERQELNSLRTDVKKTIDVIERAGSVVADLQNQLARQDNTIHDRNRVIAELQQDKELARKELSRAEDAVRAAADRTARTEARARAAETMLQTAEQKIEELQAAVANLIAAVDQSFKPKATLVA